MRLLFFLFLIIPLISTARENPFVAASQQENIPTKIATPLKTKASPAPKAKIHAQRPQVRSTSTVKKQTKPKIHPQRKPGKKEVVNYAKARFVFRENSAYIETKDKIIRHFSLVNPPSIVIDFKAASDFASKRKNLRTKPFKKLQMGAHGNRYRVVLRLDKPHKYSIKKKKYGQVVTILE